MVVPQEINNGITTRPSNSSLGYIPKRNESRDLRYLYKYIHAHSSIIHNSQKVEARSINGWMNKIWHTHTIEYYSVLKEIITCATSRMNLEDMMLSKISQSWKGKCHVILLIWSNWSSQFIETESGTVIAMGGVGRGMVVQWTQFQSYRMIRVLWMDGGGGSITMWMYFKLLSYALKTI